MPERAPAQPGYFRAVGAIVWKDLSSEFRSKEMLNAMVVFSLLVIVVFNFALELDRGTRENVAAGLLWVTFIFAGTLGFNRSSGRKKTAARWTGCCWRPWTAARCSSARLSVI